MTLSRLRYGSVLLRVVLPALWLSACARPVTDAPPPADDELAQAVDKTIQRAMPQYGVPGVAAATVERGRVVWTRGYGLADKEARTAVDSNTVFQVASISKSLASWGALRLVEIGALDLDAPIERYLTRWRLPPSPYNRAGVTARRILSHTAGLNVFGYAGYPPDAPLPTVEDSLSGASGLEPVRLVSQPGAGVSYSGGGYTVLQLAMEE